MTHARVGRLVLRTPLFSVHEAAGATFVPFAGYDMPVHYGSIKDEHMAVRSAAGLFDVSHMSNLWISGDGAAEAIGKVTTRPAATLPEGKGHYTCLMREDGTILDDTFVFRVDEDRFLMIPNAGMNQAAAEHIAAHAPADTVIADETAEWAILALQGPKARGILAKASDDEAPKFHRITPMTIADVDCLVSGTGYTGEKGVEIYAPADGAKAVWDHLMVCGAEEGIRPIGLGARDTLRLEKGYCLAGNEFKGGRSPLEANIGFCIAWDHDFLGKDALLRQKDEGHDLLLGLVQAKGIPRPDYEVHKGGQTIGTVTSGTQSPSLGQGIALAYLRGASVGEDVEVMVRGRAMAASVVQPPFA